MSLNTNNTNNESKLEELMNFGFPEDLCRQVVLCNPNGTIEQLVDQIISLSENNSSDGVDNNIVTTIDPPLIANEPVTSHTTRDAIIKSNPSTPKTTSSSTGTNLDPFHLSSLNQKFGDYLTLSFPTTKAYKMVFVVVCFFKLLSYI